MILSVDFSLPTHLMAKVWPVCTGYKVNVNGKVWAVCTGFKVNVHGDPESVTPVTSDSLLAADYTQPAGSTISDKISAHPPPILPKID